MGKIKIKYYRVPMTEPENRPEKPIRIAVIGDLHDRLFGEANNKLVEAIQKQYPDMVLSVGDLTVCKPGREAKYGIGLSLLKRLACDCPVYCINGNHEFRTKIYPETYEGMYGAISGGLRKSGIVLLEDEKCDVDIHGARLSLFGFELPAKYYKKLGKEYVTAEEIREHIGTPQENRYNILLAHNPVYFESYALWGADLTLSGHLHGGLVRLPFLGGLVSPQIKLFPKYAYGMFEKYGRRLVVTSGLGSHSFALRVNNPAEVVLLELS